MECPVCPRVAPGLLAEVAQAEIQPQDVQKPPSESMCAAHSFVLFYSSVTKDKTSIIPCKI